MSKSGFGLDRWHHSLARGQRHVLVHRCNVSLIDDCRCICFASIYSFDSVRGPLSSFLALFYLDDMFDSQYRLEKLVSILI